MVAPVVPVQYKWRMRATFLSIETFCMTYELGNFTRAARALGVTPQAASRQVAKLEKSLGAILFRRNTRHMEATQAGQMYYQSCRSALEALGAAEGRLGSEGEPAGEVRVSVPTTYGNHRFMAMLAGFRKCFPRVNVDVEISNRNVDFVREQFDMAVRMGELHDASFIARRLGDFSVGTFASPTYLAESGVPSTPAQLHDHTCALFVMPSSGRPLPWTFAPAPEALIPEAAIHVRDDVLGLVSFARAGGGLIQSYHFLVEGELERGELVEVLADHSGRSRPFSLIYPREAVMRPAVRALVDYAVEHSREDRKR